MGAVSIFLHEMDMTNQSNTTAQSFSNLATAKVGQGNVSEAPKAAKFEVAKLEVTESDLLMAGAFLAKGMTQTELSDKEAGIFGGESGAVAHAIQYAQQVAELETKACALEFEFTGVFHYEVTEVMGGWLRVNPDANQATFGRELQKRAQAFFERDCSQLITAQTYTPTESSGPGM